MTIANSGNWGGLAWEGSLEWPSSPTNRVYDLAVRLERGMTQHAAHRTYDYSLVHKHGDHEYPGGITAAMEVMNMPGHCGTHVDALGHVAVDGCVFGERDAAAAQSESDGVPFGSVEELPPLVGPGHVVDGPAIYGREMSHEDGFHAETLEAWFADRPVPGRGSIVLLRTGRMLHWNDPQRYLGTGYGVPGLSLSGARWLTELGVLAVGADTASFEHKPIWTVPSMSVHAHLLVESGVPIMESVYLETLAADGIHDGFHFVAAPLRIKGGTGSPIRPLAFVV
ncbi:MULTISPECIES: cyclase family protein [unclassified Pseudonocardia]|uniref:cyclase family protein n=1 Tax=unclassified Pseudonocardia TaxID=2619320 RepID=UPI0001FFE7A9|nr:cyclase family protein [Pseudonocardia sp. Ae707_Ps1]OLM09252.1 Cyclase family protein [Pseudonocardia sp. Ae707_Ps1]